MAVINGIAHSSGGFYPVEIQQSLRFDAASNSYLSRTFPVAGNRKTWTYSVWVKRSSLGGAGQSLFHANSIGEFHGFLQFLGDDRLRFSSNDNATTSADYRTSAVFRDTSAWCHICLSIDYTIPAVNLYVNGVLQQWGTVLFTPTTADVTAINNNVVHEIGRYTTADIQQFDGYMAESRFIDGQALDATAFGQFKNGVWVPKKYTGTYGTNGFYLDFSDGANLGADRSGNGNNYTPINLASTDIMLDSPTNNFATLNVNDNPGTILSEGNLKSTANGVGWAGSKSTISIPQSGRWYFETCVFGSTFGVGIASIDSNPSDAFYVGAKVGDYGYHPRYSGSTSKKYTGLSGVDYGVNHADGDIIGILYDADLGEIRFYHNNIDQGVAYTGLTGTFCFAASEFGTTVEHVNFGQDSSFSNTKTRQGFTDARGVGDFFYQPPEGALALCTANLPEPVFSPLDDSLPSDHFNTITYIGTGTTQSVTGVGFPPGFIWIKRRDEARSHGLFDTLRGVGNILYTNSTLSEQNLGTHMTSFDDDGFTVFTDQLTNGAGGSFVTWNWKAGGAPVTNNAGSITSTVSANAEAGFSVVSYTGTGANNSVGHGLTKPIEFAVLKGVTVVSEWVTYTTVIGGSLDYSLLSGTVGFVPTSAGEGLPTGSTLDISTNYNTAGEDYILYCFHSVEGFSKIGSYTGNGLLNDGTFVYTGFKPAYLMVKRTDAAGNWHVFDNTRDSYNPVDQILNPNLTDPETVYPDGIDFLSNGFKHLGTGAGLNADGGTYIYMAFAEMPFKYANAR